MKKIFMVRHAKSSWKDLSLMDQERPLNKRGKRDAPFMAKLLAGEMECPDAIISSPAKRAFTTATHFAKAWGGSKREVITKRSIYEANYSDIVALIQSLDDNWETVLIFGHNPIFTLFANLFPGGGHIDNVPTCGIVALESEADTWADFNENNSRVVQFYYPKQYFV